MSALSSLAPDATLVAPRRDHARKPEKNRGRGGATRRVLVIGLRAREYGTISPLLGRTHFEVDRLIHGRLADELLQTARFDLILIRVPLSDISVTELLEQVRGSRSQNNKSSLVLLVPPDEQQQARDLLGCGANHVLPIDGDKAALEAAVTQLLNIAPRKSARIPIRLEVRLGGGGASTIGMTCNMSMTGMLVETELEIERGRPIQFEFMLAHRPITGIALVVRTTRLERESLAGYGMRFVSFEGDSRRRYQSFIDQL